MRQILMTSAVVLAATTSLAWYHLQARSAQRHDDARNAARPISKNTRDRDTVDLLGRAPGTTRQTELRDVTAEAPIMPAVTPAVDDVAEPPRVSDDLEDYRQFLQTFFEEDTRDRSWEADAETRLRSGTVKLEARGIHVDDLKCRANLCRLVLVSGDADGIDAAKLDLLPQLHWHGPGMAVTLPDAGPGEHRVIAFFGREGRELPDG